MKPKTLGEMLMEDVADDSYHVDVATVVLWLRRHNITDATPVHIEAIGEVEGDQADAFVYLVRGGNASDITGCTVALLAEEGKP